VGLDFTLFVSTRTSALLRFAYLLCGDGHLAEDLTQEALVRVHRRWSRIHREDGPEPYVRKAILRQYLSWRRKRSSTEVPLSELPDPPPPAGNDRPGLLDDMWWMLATLPRKQRAVLVLRYYEDLPDADIARLLGCAPATVRVHAHHGLERLRATLRPVRTEGKP
jgi:RNA polymerase sigma-70 factor (sigma-E family)